jgi:hypothetical protein
MNELLGMDAVQDALVGTNSTSFNPGTHEINPG